MLATRDPMNHAAVRVEKRGLEKAAVAESSSDATARSLVLVACRVDRLTADDFNNNEPCYGTYVLAVLRFSLTSFFGLDFQLTSGTPHFRSVRSR